MGKSIKKQQDGPVIERKIKPPKVDLEKRLEEVKAELDQNLGELYQDMVKMRDCINKAMDRLGLERL